MSQRELQRCGVLRAALDGRLTLRKGLPRSSLYYHSMRNTDEDDFLMRLLDEQYTRTPFYGVRRMAERLRRGGFIIGPKRVRRLMREMGIEAIYPKPRAREPAPKHRVYPYLLRDVKVGWPTHFVLEMGGFTS